MHFNHQNDILKYTFNENMTQIEKEKYSYKNCGLLSSNWVVPEKLSARRSHQTLHSIL